MNSEDLKFWDASDLIQVTVKVEDKDSMIRSLQQMFRSMTHILTTQFETEIFYVQGEGPSIVKLVCKKQPLLYNIDLQLRRFLCVLQFEQSVVHYAIYLAPTNNVETLANKLLTLK